MGFLKKSLVEQYCDAQAKLRKCEDKQKNLSPFASDRKEKRVDEQVERAKDRVTAIEYQLKHPASTTTVNKKTTVSPKTTFNFNGKKKK